MKRPRDWIQPWPDGQPLAGAPRAALWLAELAQALRVHDPDDLAAATGLPVAAVQDLQHGRTWPDLHVTIAIIDELAGRG